MHDDKPDQFVDDLLEASLERYRSEEPRPGLEMRVLAGIRTRERTARRRGLGWAVAVCAGAIAIIVVVLHFTRAPVRQPTPCASLRQPVTAQPVPPMVFRQQPRLGSRGPVARVRRVATRRSRPEQFPTPLPLTEQEKLLLAYVSKAGKAGLAEGADTTDEAPITELTISVIKIAPLEIKPLDDSQLEQGK